MVWSGMVLLRWTEVGVSRGEMWRGVGDGVCNDDIDVPRYCYTYS